MRQERTKRGFLLSIIVFVFVAAIACLFPMGGKEAALVKADTSNATLTDIADVEIWDEGETVVFYLTKSDYMTAEWDNSNYQWVNTLDPDNKEQGNVCNAILDKNLSQYNYLENILIDGEKIVGETPVLMANKYQRVETLGITFSTKLLQNVQEITIKAGCQLPTLSCSYFGESFSCLELKEDFIFGYKNGEWVRKYPFAGYEAGVEYDVNETSFYKRPEGSTYQGHTEAATVNFTDVFSVNNWGDDGYTLASAPANKGDLVVLELVNPINAKEFGTLRLKVFSNIPRTFVSHNAYSITPSSLGETLEDFSIPGRSFTEIRLLSALYANEEGIIDTLVFRITSEGVEEPIGENSFFIGSFSCSYLTINTLAYADSFFIQDIGEEYHLTFRFNASGAFSGKEPLDESKILINGTSIETINRNGNFAQASWAAVQGIYQINVVLSKAYNDAGAIKNADLNYVGNNMQISKGLVLPNGEIVDRSYTCHIYANERLVDCEMVDNYETIQATSADIRVDADSADNIHFMIGFDKEVAWQKYYHASQTEAWREKELVTYANMYDKEFSSAYIAGGFKSALFDKVLINGYSIGEWHAIDGYITCVLVHYGQLNSYTLDISIDSNSEMYTPLYEALTSGEDITIEIKSGMKFVTNRQTTRDYKFVFNGYISTMEKEKGASKVFYGGKEIVNGDAIITNTQATETNLHVESTLGYTVNKAVNSNGLSFLIVYENGEEFSFTVQENIVDEIPKDNEGGCSSSLSNVSAILTIGLVLIVVAGICVSRRKKHE